MRILLAFDTDGTFWTDEDNSEYICGIIDPELLEKKIVGETTWAYVVSESPYYPKVKNGNPRFPVVNDQANRYANLMKVKEQFGHADLCLYIDDLDLHKHEAEKAGFIFVRVEQFADQFGVRKNVSSTDKSQ